MRIYKVHSIALNTFVCISISVSLKSKLKNISSAAIFKHHLRRFVDLKTCPCVDIHKNKIFYPSFFKQFKKRNERKILPTLSEVATQS